MPQDAPTTRDGTYRKWPLSACAGALLIILFLVANAMICLASARHLIRNDFDKVRLLRFLQSVEGTLSTLKDAETGERGFVITGNPQYLEPYDAARLRVGAALANVKTFAEQDRRLLDEVEELTTLVNAKLSELGAVVEARKQSYEGAQQLVATNEGKALMDQIRLLMGRVIYDAKEELVAKENSSRSSAARLEMAIWVGMFAGIALVCGIGYSIYRYHVSRIAAKMAVARSDRLARSTLDALRTQVALLDEHGKILVTNRAWQETAWDDKATDHAQAGCCYLDAVLKEENQSYNAAAIVEGIQRVSRGELAEVEFESCRRTEGSDRWCLVRVSRFDDCLPVRLVVSRENITSVIQANLEREEAFEALRESHLALRSREEQYRALADAMPQMVWSTSPTGAAEYFNQGWLRYTGRTLDENQGDGWLDCLHPDDRTDTCNKWNLAVRQCTEYSAEYRVRRGSDGSYRWHLARGTPLRDASGRIVKWYGTTTDVNDQKQLNQELCTAKSIADQANRAKSEFLANVSHEIRTPMNGVLGMTDLLLETELSNEQRESLELVKSSAESLMTVINDILDYSKIEAKKLELAPRQFRPRDLVESALKQLALRAHDKGLELTCDFDPTIPELIVGDPDRLRQVIINLVGNAIKFTEHGEVVLSTRLLEGNDDRVHLEFLVRDTGIGIPDDKLDLIFDPFAQADGSLTRQYGGTGLGLSISSQLAALMSGTLQVTSRVGHGSTFQFDAYFGPAIDLFANASSVRQVDLSGQRVLLVDDNATNLRVLSNLLSRLGATPLTLSSGAEAIQTIVEAARSSSPFDLVLLDAVMPAVDGFEVVERVSELLPSSPPAILMLTSAHRQEDAERCRQLGISAYLVKPIRANELAAAIATVIGQDEGRSAATATAAKANLQPQIATGINRVLVAEDNPVNQRVIRGILENRGLQVDVVSDGRQAVEMAKNAYDLILMDLQMPHMDGLEAVELIRQWEKNMGRHTLIVAMTSHAQFRDQLKCLASGMDAYLSKPLVRRELWDTINRLVTSPDATVPGILPGIVECPSSVDENAALPSACIDLKSLEHRVDHNVGLLEEVLALFKSTTPAIFDEAILGWNRGDRSVVERAAHSLRGAALSISAVPFANAAEQLEYASREIAVLNIQCALDNLQVEYDKLNKYLDIHEAEINA